MATNREWHQLHSAIDKIFFEFGNEIIAEPERLENLLYDLAPQSGKEVRAFCNVLFCGIIRRCLADGLHADVDYLSLYIEDNLGLKKSWAGNIAKGICRLAGKCQWHTDGVSYEVCSKGLKFSLLDGQGTYKLVGIGSCEDKDVVIPAFYKGLPVVSIRSSAFYGCVDIKSVKIPPTVKRIGAGSFSGCTSLESVHIPDGVLRVGVCAFYECESLASVNIPSGVKSIGGSAFDGCKNLASVSMSQSVAGIGDRAFSGCVILDTVVYEGTRQQWSSIMKADTWMLGSRRAEIRCADGTAEL